MIERLKNEPVIVGAIASIVAGLGILFGLPVGPDVAAGIASAVYFLIMLTVRQFVTPNRQVGKHEQQ